MSSIIENIKRIGCFTSSEIHKLMTNGKGPGGIGAPAVTYIKEKELEKKLGRSIKIDSFSQSMAWGSFLEARVFGLLDFEYKLLSNETDTHPTIEGWAGSRDLIVPGVKIGEIKCYQPKNFAQYTDVILEQNVDILRAECPEEFWQIVSSAIISEVPKGEAICYMPYQSELPEIRVMAENYDGDNQWEYKFISDSPDAKLAYLPDGGYYKNLNRFEFEIPQQDIDALTKRVEFCLTLLNQL